LAICGIKWHFFALPGLALLYFREWRYFGGLISAAGVLLAISTAVQGPGWFAEYWRMGKMPGWVGIPEYMITIRRLSWHIGWIQAIGTAAALLAGWAVMRRNTVIPGLCVALFVAVLTSNHAYLHDGVLLVPGALALTYSAPRLAWLHLIPIHRVVVLFCSMWSVVLVGKHASTMGVGSTWVILTALLALFGAAIPARPASAEGGIGILERDADSGVA
jgi:hypothetical protein